MTVGRLAASVLLCAGLGASGAIADDEDAPVEVAVPPAGGEAEPVAVALPPGGKDTTAPQSAEPGGDSAAAPSPDEEYLPLDLPPLPDVPEGAEPVVLGIPEPEAPTAVYAVHAEIMGIPNGEGVVAASLCVRRNFTKSGCRTERVAAREGRVSVTFGQVAPGAYAVQVHHDQNNNGKMDFTFFGLPKEPYGFSRDAKPMLAPPRFDAASFEVIDSDVRLVINLQNT